MMKALRWSIVLACCGGLLFGCGRDGDDGADGAPGTAGTPGPVIVATPTTLNIAVTAAADRGALEVDFSAKDNSGFGYAGLTLTDLEFTLAKLLPSENGDSSHWQSYVNRSENPGVGPGTEAKIQATGERTGTLTNFGDGRYRYRYSFDLRAMTTPLVVSYQPDLTHRVGIRVGRLSDADFPLPSNVVYDWLPQTGATANILTRKIVSTENCNQCHGRLALHGGNRVNTDYCVICHNPGTTDANSGNTVDFKVMIHRLHRGASLPSVIAGTPYQIYGFNNSLHDYSDVVYPQDIRACGKCHDDSNTQTTEAANWHQQPTLQACGSCHDDIDFAAGTAGGHDGGVVTDNSECTTCHAADRIAGSVQQSHARLTQLAAAAFKANILDVSNSAPGQQPIVHFSVTNPQQNNAPYTLAESVWSGARLSFNFAWNTRDYFNSGTTRLPASALSVNALTSRVDQGDGTFSTTLPIAIPATLSGSGAVGVEIRPRVDTDANGSVENVPVKSEVAYFSISDAAAFQRRKSVETTRCQQCHGELAGLVLHGGSRNDNVEMCVLCHNPFNTDINQRPIDADGSHDGISSAAADGKEQQAIDFKVLIHGIHGAEMRQHKLTVYGFNGSTHTYDDVRFPGVLGNCETCHARSGYTLPLASSNRGTTTDNGATKIGVNLFSSPAAMADLLDDGKTTPTAAACSACHDGSEALAHMTINGAGFNVLQSAIDAGAPTETCSVCHGPGRLADVKTVHPIP